MQFGEENRHKHLVIKQGMNKRRVLGNTVEEHRALSEEGWSGNWDRSKWNLRNVYKINISKANVREEQSKGIPLPWKLCNKNT